MSTPPKKIPSRKVSYDDPILPMKKINSYEDPFFVKTPEIKTPDTNVPPLDPNYPGNDQIEKP